MVAIILINYQSYNDTLECIETVLHSENTSFRIFVVDNSARKEEQEHFLIRLASLLRSASGAGGDSFQLLDSNQFNLASAKKKVIVINAENHGFAAANNIILRQISGLEEYKFIWLLNNDTRIYPTTLNDYIAAYNQMALERKLGVLGAVLIYLDKPSVIQGVGGIYYKLLGTSRHLLDGLPVNEYDPVVRHPIDYPIGASMLISSTFLAEVGLMEESYFLYFEELDWSVRARRKGYVCDYASRVFVEHKAGGSIGGKNKLKPRSSQISDYYFYRNRLKFSWKYTPFHFPFVVLVVGASVLHRMVRGRAGFLKLFISKGTFNKIS